MHHRAIFYRLTRHPSNSLKRQCTQIGPGNLFNRSWVGISTASRTSGTRMLVNILAIPNAPGFASAPLRASSSAAPGSSFSEALATSTSALPDDATAAVAVPSSASDPANSGSASTSTGPGVSDNSDLGNQAMPGTSANAKAAPNYIGAAISASDSISKFGAKTLSRAATNSVKADAKARADFRQQSVPKASANTRVAQAVAGLPQLAPNFVSLGTKPVLSDSPLSTFPPATGSAESSGSSAGSPTASTGALSGTTPAAVSTSLASAPLTLQSGSTVSLLPDAPSIAEAASHSSETGTKLDDSIATTSDFINAPATGLAPQTSTSALAAQDASLLPTMPLQIASPLQNSSSAPIASPSPIVSSRTPYAASSTGLPASAWQITGSLASPGSKGNMANRSGEAIPTGAPNPIGETENAGGSGEAESANVNVNVGAPRFSVATGQSNTNITGLPLPPLASNPAAAAIIGEGDDAANTAVASASSSNLSSPNFSPNLSSPNPIELPDQGSDKALSDNASRVQPGPLAPSSTTLPAPESVVASVVASGSSPASPKVFSEGYVLAPKISELSPPNPAASATAVASLNRGDLFDMREQMSSIANIKSGLAPNTDEKGHTGAPRDSDKSSSASMANKSAIPAELSSTDASVSGSDAPLDSYSVGTSRVNTGSPGSTLALSDEDAQASFAAVGANALTAAGSSGSPAANPSDPSAAIPQSVSLPIGSRSSAAVNSAASLPSSSLQSAALSSSIASSGSPAPARDPAGNPFPVIPPPSPGVAASAVPEKSGAPPELPPAHQMLDSAPVSSDDSTLASPGAHLPSDPGALQMHLGVHTNAFGNVEIHTVVEQSQVGVAIHGDRDLARWFDSEVGGLETGLKGQHLNLAALDFSSNRSGMQTGSGFQHGQPRQNFSQNQGSYPAAASNGAATVEPVPESDSIAELPFRGTEARVSILA
jgi:trimeric autotransporter adhesin